MPDVSLPPVGELVQITDVSGRTMLACRRGPAETMYSATEGLLMGREDVASWRRVLVLPDTEEMRAGMTAAAAEQMVMLDKHVGLLAEPLGSDAARQLADAALGAAIEAVR